MITNFRYFFLIPILFLLSFFFSMTHGSLELAWNHPLLLHLRLPRTLVAVSCGGLLALSGSLMQLLLQNPLADPYVLGISGGAALGTLILMMLGMSQDWLILGAWLGSLGTMLFIFFFAKRHRFEPGSLLLVGVALSCVYSAGISLILILTNAATLHSMLFWLSGDLNESEVPIFALMVLVIGLVVCFLLTPALNLLRLGENTASSLGLASKKYFILLYLLTSLFTATAVSLAGCIGFIGLMIPHLTHLLFGSDYRITLPLSVFMGSSLLMLADTFARTLFAPQQIPVGILLALIGVPFFIWLLGARK